MGQIAETAAWSPEEIAEFHLNNAMSEEGYRWAIEQVISMGLDPLKLNPQHLLRDAPWQNPELYVGPAALKQRS